MSTPSTRVINTTLGNITYSQLAPYLAKNIVNLQDKINEGKYREKEFNEDLVLDIHIQICGKLTPQFAGKWRNCDVQVGAHTPPAFYIVPIEMRNYCDDMRVRLNNIKTNEDFLLETLAFAEGKFLSVHPFQDFNGRVSRVLIFKLLKDLDLPSVDILPNNEAEKKQYISALRAADQYDYQLLEKLWEKRLSAS